MWHRDAKEANSVGKMTPIDLLNAGLPQTFNGQSTRKQSAIKQDSPV